MANAGPGAPSGPCLFARLGISTLSVLPVLIAGSTSYESLMRIQALYGMMFIVYLYAVFHEMYSYQKVVYLCHNSEVDIANMPSRASLLPMPTGGMCRARKHFSSSLALKILTILTPSFIHPLWQEEGTSTLAQALTPAHHDTAYLDGLRGLVAFVIYVFHYLVPFDRTILLGYIPGSRNSSILGLPILGLMRSGTAVVLIFFVISGYVLSISASRVLHNRDWDGVLRPLSSATLKRGVRLFIPAIATIFAIMLLVSTGLYADRATIARLPAHWPPLGPVRQTSFGAQIVDWLQFVVVRLTNPWQWYGELFSEPEPSYYGAHLWTIQNEFHCSMGVGSEGRGALWAATIAYSGFWGRWDVALFLTGMAFAYTDVQSATTASKTEEAEPITVKPNWLKASKYSRYLVKTGYITALLAGLWLASFPERNANKAVGFGLLAAIHPRAQPWNAIGAALIVWSVRRVNVIRSFLTTAPLQYLGQISLAFYIVHEPILQVFGWLYANMLRKYFITAGVVLGFHEQVNAQIGIWLAFITLTPVVFIASDYVWRGLDKPSMVLVRAIGKRV
ncbi:Acyltransferase R4-like protein [Cladobotryum mycophilum]|uniref:Acyltransferase R4-like protein n=1 Tax=Cladobotryum mycophilum TaxID=491253 RepID=A0ABR0SX62_9HYPO